MAPKIVYLSARHTRPWLTMKYADALAAGGAEVEVFAQPDNAEGFDLGIVKSAVPFRIYKPHWHIPGVYRSRALARWRAPFPSWQMAQALLLARADIYIAGEPDDLRMVAWAARLNRAKLVYMPFEFYPGLSYGDAATLARFGRFEARYAPRADSIVVLGDKLAELYRERYRVRGEVTAVYSSVPRDVDRAPRGLREQVGAGPDTVLVLYTGQVNRPRGLWDVLDAVPLLPNNVHLVVIGDKDIALLKQDAIRLGIADRVHTVDFVPQRDLIGYTAEADIGIIPIQDVCLSYRYCNPGKLFEYIGAGLPLVVRDSLAQLSWYVESRGLGEVFQSGSKESLAAAIMKLAADAAYRRRCAEAVRRIHDTEACWEIQAGRLRQAVLGSPEIRRS